MNTIYLLADIWGQTEDVQHLAEQISHRCRRPCQVLDPYLGQRQPFSDETRAYKCFIQHGGMESYYHSVALQLDKLSSPVVVIGFSAGAAVAWQLAAEPGLPLEKVIGFYGGQIRQQLLLQPQVPVTLVWPRHEAHFDLESVQQQLSATPRLEQLQWPYLHGFANGCCDNFSQTGRSQALDWLAERLGG